ncbi:prepilin peptidase [Paenibacillus sp. 28ISP30-2]|uniref:A24 family peptidase n=1 Tax=Paenibacillus terrae TaxID=159743 RepID=UPI0011EB704C|nr:A24 family peptidase [Paenibacillus terrae]MBE0343211.1 prepilin peptidase [Paenibacillus sp. 28ISP30-2]
MTWMYIVCGVLLAIALVTDLRSMKIPNKLTLPGMAMGVLFNTMSGGWHGFLFAAAGLGTGFGFMLILYWMGAVGAGDVKLFGLIGAWTGAAFAWQSALYSIFFAGIIGLVILLWRRETMMRLRRVAFNLGGFFLFRSGKALTNGREAHLRFPFMTAVIPGAISAYLYFLP